MTCSRFGLDGRLALRIFAVAVAIGASLFSAHRTIRWTSPGIVYVSGNGGLLADGSSPASAFRTVQQALDRALPGDTIKIVDGVYRERLHLRRNGTARNPIVIEAANPGGVVVSWESSLAAAVIEPWRSEGNDIYSAATSWPVYRVHSGEASLYRVPFGGLGQLRKLVTRNKAWNAFCYESGRISVWLSDGTLPGLEKLTTHRRAPEPQEWGEFRSATLTVEASHVRLIGLQFLFGVGAGVMLKDADDVEIRDCAFSGSTSGVLTLAGRTTDLHLGLQRCLYHNFPQYEWRKGWLSWGEVYAGYSSSSLLATDSDHVTVRGCGVVHAGDALRVTNNGRNGQAQADLTGNLLALGTDDAFEIEGPAKNVLIRDNLVYEFHESLGLSPVELGPVTVSGNLFLHQKDGVNGAQVKLINREANRGMIRNVLIQDNLFVGNWLCWTSGTVQDVLVKHNAFVIANRTDPLWPSGVVDTGNVYLDRAQLAGDRESSAAGAAVVEIAAGMTAVMDQNPEFKNLAPLLDRSVGPEWWVWAKHPATRTVAADVARLASVLER